MADKYQHKYRIPSARLQGYDYGQNGAYFLTICTNKRQHFFGEIVDTQFIAYESGELADKYWLEIPEHFPFVELGNYVVMPNHVHGILIIDKMNNIEGGNCLTDLDCEYGMDGLDGIDDTNWMDGIDGTNWIDGIVETRLIASLPGGITGINNPMFHDNISRIMRWFKGRCAFEIHKINEEFKWQSKFHDHIIRNAKSFENIQNYIANNPKNWKDDKFYC